VAKHPSKTEQRSKRQPIIRQRSDGGGKTSTKMMVTAKHPPVKHKPAAKHPLETIKRVDIAWRRCIKKSLVGMDDYLDPITNRSDYPTPKLPDGG
jgi:hypothetical protein